MTNNHLNCWIYRGSVRNETYLYLANKDAFEMVPKDLLKALGRLEFVMELKLNEKRPLARADVTKVMAELNTKGFYLQLPPAEVAARNLPH